MRCFRVNLEPFLFQGDYGGLKVFRVTFRVSLTSKNTYYADLNMQ
jgi:hypothetical protein